MSEVREWNCEHETFEDMCKCFRCGETLFNNENNSAIPKYLDRIANLKQSYLAEKEVKERALEFIAKFLKGPKDCIATSKSDQKIQNEFISEMLSEAEKILGPEKVKKIMEEPL